MADELIIQNFVAKSAIYAGQAVANVIGDTMTAPQCQPAGLTGEKIHVLGVALKDSAAGEAVTIAKLVPGVIVKCRAGAAVTAGVPIGIDANGDFVDASSGTAGAPLFSKEAAAAAGDYFCAVIVHTCGII